MDINEKTNIHIIVHVTQQRKLQTKQHEPHLNLK